MERAKGISDHASMKLNNQLAVLRCIRDEGPITRANLKKMTRLGWGTITMSTKELLGREIITEIGSITTGVGRRPVELDLNRRKNFILGLQLGSILIRVVLVDLKGTMVDGLEVPVNARGSSQEILATLLKTGRQFLRRHSIANSSLAGIGIAAPGAVDFSTGVCFYAPHHPHLKDMPLKKRFEQAFGVPCYVDHSYNCFALSEKLFGLGKGVDNFIGVLIGTGLSAGIVVNGELYRGANCYAGEFGHTSIDRNGPLCACGNNGCVEAYVSGPAMVRMATEEITHRPDSIVSRLVAGDTSNITAKILESAARQGDPLAQEIFARMGTILGVGLSNLINILNPQSIILGGRVVNASEFFMPSCLETVEKRSWHASIKDVKVSRLRNGVALGAAALVFQQLFSTGQIL